MIGPGHARTTIATPPHINRIHRAVQAGRAEQIAEIADRQLVYLRSSNSEPRHKHDASTMTDTRRAWSGAETSWSAGPDASVLDPRAGIFNSALQRDRLPEKTDRFGLRLVDERNLRGAALA